MKKLLLIPIEALVLGGALLFLIILMTIDLVFSVPSIEKCQENGVIISIEGTDKCVEKDSIKEIK
jgi:hypothetical protein